MLPPRLPRHLRPCRPLWSAPRVRFASDKPYDSRSTAGGDGAASGRAPEEGRPEADSSLASSPSYRVTRVYAPTAKKPGVHSREGRRRRDVPAVQAAVQPAVQPEGSSQRAAYKSQAEKMRQTLGGASAASAVPQLRISKHLAAQENVRVAERVRAALATKVQLEEKRHAEAPSDTEVELRERLKKLEEHLALLQAKLDAGGAVTAEPVEQLPNVPGTATDQQAAVEGRDSDSPPSTTTAAEKSPSSRPIAARKRASKTAADRAPTTATTEKATLAQQIHAQRIQAQSSRPPPPAPSSASDEVSEQSLLDELFPEASSHAQPAPVDRRPSPPKLDLPAPDTNPRIRLTPTDPRTDREKAIDVFRARGEQTTVLQLSHCSTALTEADFRRLVPRGQHIETWSRDGDFYKIIPGRDPLSLERLPFYYLLFHTPASALAYQKNASRLSKLSALHAPSSIHSAMPPPPGFLEDGEDLHAVTSSFVLHPTGHALDLRTVMQPYNRALRALIDAGGYAPIVPNVDSTGKKIHRVLLHIDGYEPSHWDLWQIISRHAHARGIIWPFRNDHASAVRRLRDTINLKTTNRLKFQAVSSSNPRAASPLSSHEKSTEGAVEYEDPMIASFLGTASASASDSSDAGSSAKETNQLVMNRVYNRWIVEFEDEDAARRFAGLWHRVVLPDAKDKRGAWREAEEVRWVAAEYLW